VKAEDGGILVNNVLQFRALDLLRGAACVAYEKYSTRCRVSSHGKGVKALNSNGELVFQ
jgi:hypothetical protein